MARESGTVKWFSDAKGYGFLVDAHGHDIFVHIRDTTLASGDLKPGQRVEYTRTTDTRGPRASDVCRPGDVPRGRSATGNVFEQAKATARHCTATAYPTNDPPVGADNGWKLWDAVWKEEEYDSPKRGAIPRQWIRNRASLWLTTDGRLLFLDAEEGESTGWVDLPGYGWVNEYKNRQSWSRPPYIQELATIEDLRSTHQFLNQKRHQTSRSPGASYKTTINSLYLGNKGADDWLSGLLAQITQQADAGAPQRIADREQEEARLAQARATRLAAAQRATSKARSAADTPFTTSQPTAEVRLKFAQGVTGFRDAKLASLRLPGGKAAIENSDDGAWAVVRLQPRLGRLRWWRVYADAQGTVRVARAGRGTSPRVEEAEDAFLARETVDRNSLVTRAETETFLASHGAELARTAAVLVVIGLGVGSIWFVVARPADAIGVLLWMAPVLFTLVAIVVFFAALLEEPLGALIGVPIALAVVWIVYSLCVGIWKTAASTDRECPSVVASLFDGNLLCKADYPQWQPPLFHFNGIF